MDSDSPPAPEPVHDLDPNAALLPGGRDARVVLGLWYLRRMALPFLLLGIFGALVSHREAVIEVDLGDTAETTGLLRSPLAGFVIAAFIRIGVRFAAVVPAWRVAARHHRQRRARSGGRGHLRRGWLDEWRLTQALRMWRWTAEVRAAALERIPEHQRRWWDLDRWFRVANLVLVAALVIAVLTV